MFCNINGMFLSLYTYKKIAYSANRRFNNLQLIKSM